MNTFNRLSGQGDVLAHIEDSFRSGEIPIMAAIEIRGDYQVTIHPDHEVWQMRYTDGVLGEEHVIANNNKYIPVCKICLRKWSSYEKHLKYDQNDGKVICPDCQNK